MKPWDMELPKFINDSRYKGEQLQLPLYAKKPNADAASMRTQP
jgi:hypothetical protein